MRDLWSGLDWVATDGPAIEAALEDLDVALAEEPTDEMGFAALAAYARQYAARSAGLRMWRADPILGSRPSVAHKRRDGLGGGVWAYVERLATAERAQGIPPGGYRRG